MKEDGCSPDVHAHIIDLGYMDISVEFTKISAGKIVLKPQKTGLGIRIFL